MLSYNLIVNVINKKAPQLCGAFFGFLDYFLITFCVKTPLFETNFKI